MTPAFQGFSDPYAWLIRGLIEYGWEDMSLRPRAYPQLSGRGLDTSHLSDPLSKYGLRLVVLATDATGQWNRRDETYEFEVRWIKDLQRRDCILLRSDEMAYSQLFPFTPDTPLYAGGYIHEAVVEKTARFTEQRKQGERVSSIDMQEMLNYPLIPPPPQLQQYIQERLRYGRDFNTATQEGLWFNPQQQFEPQPEPVQQISQPVQQQPAQQQIPQQNNAVQQPTFRISEGLDRGQLLRGEQGIAGQDLSMAMVIVENAARALKFVAGMAMFIGLLAVVNSMYTVYMTHNQLTVRTSDSYVPVIITSAVLGFLGIIGGWAAWYCNKYYSNISSNALAWLPMIFCGLYPLTIFIGLPVALFAGWKWQQAPVKKLWTSPQST